MDYKEKLARTQERALKREQKLKDRLAAEKLRGSLKRKKKTIKQLKKELQTITHRIVRLSANVCFTCQKPLEFKDRQAGHFYTRGGHPGVAFDLRNIQVQCNADNLFKSGDLANYAYYLRQKLGESEYDDLHRRANEPHKWTREQLETLLEERKNLLTQFENGQTN